MARDTSTLIYAWQSGSSNTRLRAIASGHSTRGYRDNIIVERCEIDALGGERWTTLRKWPTNTSGSTYGVNEETKFLTALVDGIESALKERDATLRANRAMEF